MRTIGRRGFGRTFVRGVAFVAALPARVARPQDRTKKTAGEEETPFARLAKLASYLSQNSIPEALACFDSKMKDYAIIEADIEAVGAQTDVLCAIDIVQEAVVQEKGEGERRKLDTDWFVELRSQADGGPVERRRERVQMEMKKLRSTWKIVAMAPISILDPIHIPGPPH